MERLAWVCLGGAVGSGARYLVSSCALARWSDGGIPWGTLCVNVTGSFLIGLILRLGSTTWLSPTTQLALTVGVLGGFTTYSAFAYETFVRIEQGAWLLGSAYALGTVAVCLAAVYLGNAAARAWVGS